MAGLPRVVLKPARAKPFYSGHPWVYAGAIAVVEGEPDDGAEVAVHAHGGQFIARGWFNSRSRIRVRLYSWDPDQPLDATFLRSKLNRAISLRRDVLGLCGPRQACRLVYSEGDGLSGLTVDRYDDWLVLQFTALAMAQRRELLADLLQEIISCRGIYLRTERGIGQLEGLELQDGPLRGDVPDAPIEIEEKGVRYLVDIAEGQKTGFYLDQRENRNLVAGFTPGRRVLDAFCYSGGFSLASARAGAAEVIGVDVSQPAIDLAKRNLALNFRSESEPMPTPPIRFVHAEVFDFLRELASEGERFDMVILDPPKFARTRSAIGVAMQGYRRLQTLAFRLLRPDGILVTCCCSGLITSDMLRDLLGQVSASCRRRVQLLAERGQPPDHPVSIACPQSAYLKCLIGRVE